MTEARDKLKTLVGLLERTERWGEREAIVALRKEDVERWDFARLRAAAGKLAAGLREAGLQPGDHAVLIATSSPGWIAACLGAIEAGVVPTPLDIQISSDHLAGILGDVRPPVIFTQKSQADRIDNLELEHRPRVVLLDADESDERSWTRLLNEKGGEQQPPAAPDPEDEAVLFFTSGTTGPPKGVPLSHRNISFQLNALIEAGFVTEHDRLLNPLPLHHVYPFVIGILTPIALGIPIVLPHSLTGPQIMRALREGHVTIVIGVPRLYRALVSGIESRIQNAGRIAGGILSALLRLSTWTRRRLGIRIGKQLLFPLHRQVGPDLRVMASGGSAISPEVAWTIEGLGWQIASGYGLTETSPMLTMDPPGKAQIGTAGKALEGVEIRIDPSAKPGADEDDEADAAEKTNADAAPSTADHGTPKKARDGEERNSVPSDSRNGATPEGEILARGPGIFSGYRNLPDKTREALDEDGWFHTGDLGYLDEEGYLHITGRVSTMIVTEGGENVYPEDVEETYEKHPAIKEIAVLEKDGKLVGIIVPDPKAAGGTDSQSLEETIRKAVDEQAKSVKSFQRLADYAVTRESIPRTRLGKPRRHLLVELYEKAKRGETGGAEEEAGPMPVEQMSDEDRALMDQPAAREVWDWLAEEFSDQRLTPSTSPQLDLGIDSLEWLNLTMEIRQRTGVELTEEAVGRIETVRDLLNEVAEAATAGAEEGPDPLERPEEVLKEDQKHWLEPLNGGQRAVARALDALNAALMRSLFRLEVEGLDRLPKDRQVVITPNHASYVDPFAVAAALRFERLERTWWAGWTGVAFANPLFRWGSRMAQVVPIDRERAIVSSLAFGAAVLRREHNLIWFPEGRRSPSGELLRFQAGVGMLLDRYRVPVVPVFIHGAFEALPADAKWPRFRKIRVVIGEPVDPERLIEEGEGKENHQKIADALRRRVAELGGVELPEEREARERGERGEKPESKREQGEAKRDEEPPAHEAERESQAEEAAKTERE